MFSLSEKCTLVTGAGSGIGAAIAQRFAQAGGFVYVVDVDEGGGRETERRITDAGGRTRFVACDVTTEGACEALAERVMDAHGRLDVLVNNAGIGHVGTLLQTSGEDMDRLYAVNVRGVFNVTREFLPRMVACRSGSIINMASIGGLVGVRDRLAYCATKFAVVGMTKAMALDHAADGVRVNCICPGRVETAFVRARLAEYPDPQKAFRDMCATQPMGRMGRPEEVADAALYLASDASAFVTGTALSIDGGWYAGK
jgi:NAD(P)-dependent dehydrogenase (short-subunit alcohol dehydrogenase family)